MTPEAAASSGIHTAPTGERHIPQSTRADGSVRKEIRIRPGYRPPEDVEVYKNRTADAWKNRGSKGIPGAESLPSTEEGGNKGKNAKRREARKKAKASGDCDIPDANSMVKTLEGRASPPAQQTVGNKPGDEGIDQGNTSSQSDKEKQARNIKKKLRQAKELQNKKESGESLLPEQLAKVIKIHELVRQLDALGLEYDGLHEPTDNS